MIIENISCHEEIEESIEGNLKIIDCQGLKWYFESGPTAYQGPKNLKTTFVQSFRAYYHTKFFDSIFIEEKLRKIFLDSVRIHKVWPKTSNSSHRLLFECIPCNAVAELEFNNVLHYFPFQSNDQYIEDYGMYFFDIKQWQGGTSTKYFTKDQLGEPVGIFLNDKDGKYISFYTRPSNKKQLTEAKRILSSIRFK